MVSPVDDAAFLVPLVLAEELHSVAFLQATDALGQVDVVGDQDGLAGREPEQELLVAAAFVVIGQDPANLPGALNLQITLLVLVGGLQQGGAILDGFCCGGWGYGWGFVRLADVVGPQGQDGDKQ